MSYLQSTGSLSFTQLIKSSTTCIALYKTFHCGNDKLTPTLVGIVSVFQNLRSTLLLPFHSVSSAYLLPHRGTLTGMFNAWVWYLANVTAKASYSRSPCVFWFWFTWHVEWSVSLCSRLVVSFCILLSDWFFFLGSDWLIGRKWRLLIGQISWLLIGWRWNTSQSFYHPIIS